MKKLTVLVFLIVFAFILQIKVIQADPPGEQEEGALSPYFFVEGDPKVDHFPLLETKTKVNIDYTAVYQPPHKMSPNH